MVSIASFGTGRTILGIVAAVPAAVGFVFELTWIARQRKRVVREERRRLDEHGTPPPGINAGAHLAPAAQHDDKDVAEHSVTQFAAILSVYHGGLDVVADHRPVTRNPETDAAG